MSGEQSSIGKAGKIYASRNLKSIAARWDARAKSWDQALEDPSCHLNEDDAYCRFIRVVQRLIAQRRRFCAPRGIIDAGCGTGLVLAKVISSFSWGIGVDISPKMVRAARAKRLPNARFVVGDCFDLPSLCPKAGVIMSRGVLLSHYGLDQGQAILRSSWAALAPGGFLVFDFLNEAARTKFKHTTENKTWFGRGEIRSMARRAGFSTVNILGKPNHRVLLLMGKR